MAFLTEEVVLLAASVYLLKQDAVRMSRAEADQSERQQVGETRDWAAMQLAAT